MSEREERFEKILHDTTHRLAVICELGRTAMYKMDIKLQEILLDKQELEGMRNGRKDDE